MKLFSDSGGCRFCLVDCQNQAFIGVKINIRPDITSPSVGRAKDMVVTDALRDG